MFDVPVVHLDGSVFFTYRISGREHRIQVTREALTSLFRSDGTEEGNEISLRENAEAILRAAANKVRRGGLATIQVTPEDF